MYSESVCNEIFHAIYCSCVVNKDEILIKNRFFEWYFEQKNLLPWVNELVKDKHVHGGVSPLRSYWYKFVKVLPPLEFCSDIFLGKFFFELQKKLLFLFPGPNPPPPPLYPPLLLVLFKLNFFLTTIWW